MNRVRTRIPALGATTTSVVERMIGRKPGTGGSEGVGYLAKTLDKRCFPELWEVRTHLSGSGEYGDDQELTEGQTVQRRLEAVAPGTVSD